MYKYFVLGCILKKMSVATSFFYFFIYDEVGVIPHADALGSPAEPFRLSLASIMPHTS